jgi:hypothetical protein
MRPQSRAVLRAGSFDAQETSRSVRQSRPRPLTNTGDKPTVRQIYTHYERHVT